MKSIIRLVLSFGISLATAFIAAEIFIRIYIYNSGMPRAEHSDDYAMAFYTLVTAASVFSVVAIFCVAYIGKSFNQKDGK